jgi:hypothetical protein
LTGVHQRHYGVEWIDERSDGWNWHMPFLEEVFRLSGVPTYTFVEPVRYSEIKVSVRTPGRCLVMEGPSGIGKTTTITKAISDLKTDSKSVNLSARRKSDVELISILPEMKGIGTVIVDDFHRLDDSIKSSLSDYMKILADSQDDSSKLILIGINKAGQQLVKFAHDLGMRIDVFRLEANPDEKIEELITLGEKALNITISNKMKIADQAHGSFQIAQLLCHKLCTLNNVTETASEHKTLTDPIEVLIEDVMVDLARQFKEPAIAFARGSKLRREGRAPYLFILRWLADSDEWSLDLAEALNSHPEHRGSVGQVLEKKYLQALLEDPEKDVLSQHFHFEQSTYVLSAEDPKLMFYLKNLVWRSFTKKVGFTSEYFERKYDFALSFAGSDRHLAKRLSDLLIEREVSVFYDENEQHRIIAGRVEEYLAPIYRSEAAYVVPLLSPSYPTRIWTKFESDNFKERFGENAVVPIRFSNVVVGYFSDDQSYGGLPFRVEEDAEEQLQMIAEVLCKRIIEDRQKPLVPEPEPEQLLLV